MPRFVFALRMGTSLRAIRVRVERGPIYGCISGVEMKRMAAASMMLVALMLVADLASAKGGVERITIAGPGLEEPIEIRTSQVLAEFNPWGGLLRFVGEQVSENGIDATLQGPYKVSFFESTLDWVYEFSYYSDN